MRMYKKYQAKRGYTLIEALLTILLSAIVLLAMSGLIGSLFKNYRAGRQLQIDLENARVALSVMTKTMRPVTPLNADGSVLDGQNAVAYGYDAAGSRCVAFQFDGVNHKIRFGTLNGITRWQDCGNISNIAFQDLTSSTITSASFQVTGSKPIDFPGNNDGHVGSVTVRFTVQTDAAHTADLQTSVSLRDYEYVGFKK